MTDDAVIDEPVAGLRRSVVIGGGTMGVGIAYVLARQGFDVTVVEPATDRHDAIWSTVDQVSAGGVKRGAIDEQSAAGLRCRIHVTDDLSTVAPRPAVIVEAVPESLELKRDVLARAARLEPELLGTNTSSISIDEIASGIDSPDRLIGLHFFNPVWVNALVEIVVGERTGDDVLARARQFVEEIGKEAVVVRDRPGFATSRLGVLLGLEAIRMVEEGVAEPAAIDRAMELGYRHPMGPLRLTDLVGLDVRLSIAENLERSYGGRFAPPQLLRDMVAQGRLGKKSGRGFYEWGDSLV